MAVARINLQTHPHVQISLIFITFILFLLHLLRAKKCINFSKYLGLNTIVDRYVDCSYNR